MSAVLVTLLVAFASALLPFINIEAYLGAAAVAVKNTGIWQVALAAAIGQTIGKVVLYYAAGGVMQLSWIKKKTATPKWQASYQRWQNRIEHHPGQTALVLFGSASLGFPPLLVIAVLAGHLRVRIWLFVAMCLTGRWLRFLVILGAADWLVNRF